MHPKSSRENLLKRTKIVLHCLAIIDSVERIVEVGARPDPLRIAEGLKGVMPFRLWRRSPPVVKCAGFIGGGYQVKMKGQRKKRFWRLQKSALRGDSQNR